VALIPARFLSALSVVGGILPAAGLGLLLRSLGKASCFLTLSWVLWLLLTWTYLSS